MIIGWRALCRLPRRTASSRFLCASCCFATNCLFSSSSCCFLNVLKASSSLGSCLIEEELITVDFDGTPRPSGLAPRFCRNAPFRLSFCSRLVLVFLATFARCDPRLFVWFPSLIVIQSNSHQAFIYSLAPVSSALAGLQPQSFPIGVYSCRQLSCGVSK